MRLPRATDKAEVHKRIVQIQARLNHTDIARIAVDHIGFDTIISSPITQR